MTLIPKLNYIEFAVGDMARAKKFYGDAFGWSFTDFGPGYTEFTDGEMKGGFFPSEGPVKNGGPMIVLMHDQLEALLPQVEAAGATITAQIYGFPGGERFEFTDPDGHSWAIWRGSAVGEAD